MKQSKYLVLLNYMFSLFKNNNSSTSNLLVMCSDTSNSLSKSNKYVFKKEKIIHKESHKPNLNIKNNNLVKSLLKGDKKYIKNKLKVLKRRNFSNKQQFMNDKQNEINEVEFNTTSNKEKWIKNLKNKHILNTKTNSSIFRHEEHPNYNLFNNCGNIHLYAEKSNNMKFLSFKLQKTCFDCYTRILVIERIMGFPPRISHQNRISFY